MKLCLDVEDAMVFYSEVKADRAVMAVKAQTRTGFDVYANNYEGGYYIVVSDSHYLVYVQEL